MRNVWLRAMMQLVPVALVVVSTRPLLKLENAPFSTCVSLYLGKESGVVAVTLTSSCRYV